MGRPEIVAILACSAFLLMFYKAVQLQWPESYFGANDLAAYSVSASPMRYLAFRFGPPYLACVFAYVSLDRIHRHGATAVAAIVAIHALLRPCWILYQSVHWPRAIWRHRVPLLLLNGAVIIGLVASGLLAVASASTVRPLIPRASELSATLWTALIAGVVGAFVIQTSRGAPIGEEELIKRGRRLVPERLWAIATQEARTSSADVDLVHAVMVVECLQRPRWFRRMETVKALIWRRGSYGIMQIDADKPVSDEESIHRAVVERFAGLRVPLNEWGVPDDTWIEAFARRYNPNPNFVALVRTAYWRIRSDAQSDDIPPPPI